MSQESKPDWERHGVKIVRSHELDTNTPQTSGLTRAAAIDHARTGATKIWGPCWGKYQVCETDLGPRETRAVVCRVGGSADTVTLWDVAAGREKASLKGRQGERLLMNNRNWRVSWPIGQAAPSGEAAADRSLLPFSSSDMTMGHGRDSIQTGRPV